MGSIFFILLILTMLAVVAVLLIGILGMARGGEFSKKYGNKLMRMRVFLQAGALVFFILTVLAYKK